MGLLIKVHGRCTDKIVLSPCTWCMHLPCTSVHLADLHVHLRAPLVLSPVSPVHLAPPSPGGSEVEHEPEQEHTERYATPGPDRGSNPDLDPEHSSPNPDPRRSAGRTESAPQGEPVKIQTPTRRRLAVAVAGALALAALAGCSVADPDTSQEVIEYSGGPFSNQAFIACTDPGVRDVSGPNDQFFYYPAGRRVFTFRSNPDGSIAPGADEGAISMGTHNNVQMTVSGAITFRLNTDCTPFVDHAGKHWPGGKLQEFHDTIGKQNHAYAESGGDEPPSGWDAVLRNFLGGPASKAFTNAGLGYNWQDIYGDPATKDAWIKQVTKDIPPLIDQQAGDSLFVIENVQLDQPKPPAALVSSLNDLQAANVRQQTAQVDQGAAASFPGGISGYSQYQQQQAINKAIQEGRVQVLPVPYGSSVVVNPGR